MASSLQRDGARRAAVVVPILTGPHPSVLFVRRAAHLRRNAGQVGFPGGLVEAADGGDLRLTALRELEEEVGIPQTRVTIVHRLPDALVINRSVLVAPFVGVVDPPLELRLDYAEVEGTFDVPLARLAEPGALREQVEAFGALRIPTLALDFGPHHIWGATAWMLRSLLAALERDASLRETLIAYGVPESDLPAANPARSLADRELPPSEI